MKFCVLAKIDETRMSKSVRCQEEAKKVERVLYNTLDGATLRVYNLLLWALQGLVYGRVSLMYRVKGGKDMGLAWENNDKTERRHHPQSFFVCSNAPVASPGLHFAKNEEVLLLVLYFQDFSLIQIDCYMCICQWRNRFKIYCLVLNLTISSNIGHT